MSATDEPARWSEALAFARACALDDIDAARAIHDTTPGTGFGIALRVAGLVVLLVDKRAQDLAVPVDIVWAELGRWANT